MCNARAPNNNSFNALFNSEVMTLRDLPTIKVCDDELLPIRNSMFRNVAFQAGNFNFIFSINSVSLTTLPQSAVTIMVVCIFL